MKTRLFTVALLLLTTAQLVAQSIKTDFDKKIIFTDSLNMPINTSAVTLIAMLPELLQRPDGYILSNYDVQVEGMSVGSAADEILSTLRIADILKIEVCESPISSYLNNGQGGNINFILRTSGAEKSDAPLWGSVSLTASSHVDVVPQVNIGYRKDRFMVRGFVLGEITNQDFTQHTTHFNKNVFSKNSVEETNYKFRNEMARAYLQYEITDHDLLKLNLSETYTYETQKNITDFNEEKAISETRKRTDIHALLQYKHQNKKSTFTAQMEMKHSPRKNTYDKPFTYMYDGKIKNNNLSGKIEYKTLLFKTAAQNRGEITVGSNFNNSFGDEKASYADRASLNEPQQRIIPKNNTNYLMPYLAFTCVMGKVRLKAMGEFQHFKYTVDLKDKPYSAISNDFTGKLMAEWQCKPAHRLRLILDRKLQRPSSEQLYPYLNFDIKGLEYVIGNPDLDPSMVHEVAVDYLGHLKFKDEHNLTINAGVSYNKVSDIITSFHAHKNNNPGTLGLTLMPRSYANTANNDISCANLMALYTYKDFSLSVVSNFYHKVENLEENRNHYSYYNISIHPYFNLKNGWYGGARFVYFSRIEKSDGWSDGQATTTMTVGKSWKNFSVFLTENIAFLRKQKDVKLTDTKRSEKTSSFVSNHVGLGLRYNF